MRAIGPGVSSVVLSGSTPWQLTRPMVVFRPVIPHHEDGIRTEPPVSVPMPHGAMPAATATPVPELEPPGARWVAGSHGFHGVPMWRLVPKLPMANSTEWVLPSTIMPAASMRRTSVAVSGETRVLPHLRAAGRDAPLDVDDVLHRDRDAVQRAHRVPGATRGVRRGRRRARLLGIDMDEGMQLRVLARDALEQAVDQRRRSQLARSERVAQAVNRQRAGMS